MDIKEVYENLLTLKTTLNNLLVSTHYKESKNVPAVEYNHNNADACMYYDEICSIFTHVDFINSALAYLQHPVIESGVIKNINGEPWLNQIQLTINDVVEILITDEDSGTSRWRPVILHPHSNLNGQVARIRSYKSQFSPYI